MDYEIMMNGNVKIGTYAPDFEATTTMGNISLNQYKGKWVVLFSHPRRLYPRLILQFGEIWKKPDIALFCFDDKLFESKIKMAQNRLWSDWLERKIGSEQI